MNPAGRHCSVLRNDSRDRLPQPDEAHVSASLAGRRKLAMRMNTKRFTRLGNGYSKKVRAHECAAGLHYMRYHVGRIGRTLCVTPATEAIPAIASGLPEEIMKLGN